MNAHYGGLILFGAGLTMFITLLAWAAWGDVRRYLIPNKISLLILAAYVPFSLGAAFLPDFYPSVNWFGGLIVGGAVLLVGFLLFMAGIMGGGDVKLLASTSVWAGPSLVFHLLMATALAGGLMAVVMLAFHLRRRRETPDTPAPTTGPLPYGVAIATGGWAVAGLLAATVWSAA